MRSLEALDAALALVGNPVLVRGARRAALPAGMLLLLEVAAGDAEGLAVAKAHTERSESVLREAAGFFIEQVMLDARADKYRILGASRDIDSADLRRHMALLMRWLHPDVVQHDRTHSALDRSVFADLVTEAWEALKSEERRATYEAGRLTGAVPAVVSGWQGMPVLATGSSGPDDESARLGRRRRSSRRLVVRRLDRPSLWARLMTFLRWRR